MVLAGVDAGLALWTGRGWEGWHLCLGLFGGMDWMGVMFRVVVFVESWIRCVARWKGDA